MPTPTHTVRLSTFSFHAHILGKSFIQIPIWMCLISLFCLYFALVKLNPPVISPASHNFDYFGRFPWFLAILAIFDVFWLFLEAFWASYRWIELYHRKIWAKMVYKTHSDWNLNERLAQKFLWWNEKVLNLRVCTLLKQSYMLIILIFIEDVCRRQKEC